jgi:hypothetical protein
MPINRKINGDESKEANIGFRRYLESCRDKARRLAPLAEFALGGLTEYIYGTANADDVANDRGLVEYWLRFANGEEDVSTRDMSLRLQREMPGRHLQADPEFKARLARDNAKLAPEEVDARRTQSRRHLANICRRHKSGQRIKFQDAGSEYFLRDVWALPTLKQEPLHLAPFWVITSADALDAFVGVLLLDEKRSFGRGLRHCALEGCHRFFLQPIQAGRPQQYCNEEHSKKAHEGGSARRAFNSRLRASARRLLIVEHGRRYTAEIKAAVEQSFKERPSTTVEEMASHAWDLVQAQRKHK